MAAHYVAIAKASFAAGLLRPDPVSVSREEISRFHTTLDETLQKCSVPNVQKCKTWLLENVIPSSTRTTALGKYLAALSTSLDKSEYGAKSSTNDSKKRDTSVRRKRLHLIYVLNDLLHEAKYHQGSRPTHASLTSNLQSQMVSIFTSAASFNAKSYPKQHKRLYEVLHIWEENSYYSEIYIQKLRDSVDNAGLSISQNHDGDNGTQSFQSEKPGSRVVKDVLYSMPATHGDQNTPYHDLPAGNLMPHIVPNSNAPINPQLVKPLHFVAGPADKSLVAAVKTLLGQVRNIYDDGDDDDLVNDIDEMGQPMIRDETTSDLKAAESYYGWSIEFCERMKRRKKGGVNLKTSANTRSLSRSSSRSYSRSVTPDQRRSHREYSRGKRGRDRSHSLSGSRTASEDSFHGGTSPQRGRRSRSTSRGLASRDNKRARTRSPSEGARRYPQRSQQRTSKNNQSIEQVAKPPHAGSMNRSGETNSSSMSLPTVPLQPNQFQQNFPMFSGQISMPPPPPGFPAAPWPPPVPSALPAGMPLSFAQLAQLSNLAQQAPNLSALQPGSWSGSSDQNYQQNNGASQSSPAPNWPSSQHYQNQGSHQNSNQTWTNSDWHNRDDSRKR